MRLLNAPLAALTSSCLGHPTMQQPPLPLAPTPMGPPPTSPALKARSVLHQREAVERWRGAEAGVIGAGVQGLRREGEWGAHRSRLAPYNNNNNYKACQLIVGQVPTRRAYIVVL